jgi:hypothetical protein
LIHGIVLGDQNPPPLASAPFHQRLSSDDGLGMSAALQLSGEHLAMGGNWLWRRTSPDRGKSLSLAVALRIWF